MTSAEEKQRHEIIKNVILRKTKARTLTRLEFNDMKMKHCIPAVQNCHAVPGIQCFQQEVSD